MTDLASQSRAAVGSRMTLTKKEWGVNRACADGKDLKIGYLTFQLPEEKPWTNKDNAYPTSKCLCAKGSQEQRKRHLKQFYFRRIFVKKTPQININP